MQLRFRIVFGDQPLQQLPCAHGLFAPGRQLGKFEARLRMLRVRSQGNLQMLPGGVVPAEATVEPRHRHPRLDEIRFQLDSIGERRLRLVKTSGRFELITHPELRVGRPGESCSGLAGGRKSLVELEALMPCFGDEQCRFLVERCFAARCFQRFGRV